MDILAARGYHLTMHGFFANPFKRPDETQAPGMAAARGIAKAFLESETVKADLNPHGISKMSVTWQGVRVTVDWYRLDHPVGVTIGTDRGLPEGECANLIFSAAWKRAGRHTQWLLEKLDEMETGA